MRMSSEKLNRLSCQHFLVSIWSLLVRPLAVQKPVSVAYKLNSVPTFPVISLAPKNEAAGRRQNMSLNKKPNCLSHFYKRHVKANPIVVADIRKAYETAIGKKVPASTIYRLLARHGWRPLQTNHAPDKIECNPT